MCDRVAIVDHGRVGAGGGPLLASVAAALADDAVPVADLRSEEANLEDAFLALTGRAPRD